MSSANPKGIMVRNVSARRGSVAIVVAQLVAVAMLTPAPGEASDVEGKTLAVAVESVDDRTGRFSSEQVGAASERLRSLVGEHAALEVVGNRTGSEDESSERASDGGEETAVEVSPRVTRFGDCVLTAELEWKGGDQNAPVPAPVERFGCEAIDLSAVASDLAEQLRDRLLEIGRSTGERGSARWQSAAIRKYLANLQSDYLYWDSIEVPALYVAALREIGDDYDPVDVTTTRDGATVEVRIAADGEAREFATELRSLWGMVRPLEETVRWIDDKTAGSPPREDVVWSAAWGIAEALDEGSLFLPPDQAINFELSTTEPQRFRLPFQVKFRDGIPVVVARYGADIDGPKTVRQGDEIVAIEGQSTEEMTEKAIREHFPGGHASVLEITVRRKDDKTFTTHVARARVNDDGPWSGLYGDGIGYLEVGSLDFDRGERAVRHLATLEEQAEGLDGLILDLRGADGRMLSAVVDLADRLLVDGGLARVRAPEMEGVTTVEATESGNEGDYPIVVLVDDETEGGAEILAGALKAHGRAVVAGEETAGNFRVSKFVEFPDGAAALPTAADCLGSDGEPRDTGLDPHVAADEPSIAASTFRRLWEAHCEQSDSGACRYTE